MDFTLEDWEQLGLDQGDLFWDKALDNYQNLFLLSECAPQPCSVTPVAPCHPQDELPAPEHVGASTI